MAKQIIRPSSLPDPSGSRAYSHGVRVGNLLFPAGQTASDGQPEPGVRRFESQTRRAFARMQSILEAAGGSLDHLVTMTVFITDMRYGDEFVRLRHEILQREFPASALIGISHLATRRRWSKSRRSPRSTDGLFKPRHLTQLRALR